MKCVHCGRGIHAHQVESANHLPLYKSWVHNDTHRKFCGKAPSDIATPAESPRKRPARTSR